jgi:hypothetical protein
MVDQEAPLDNNATTTSHNSRQEVNTAANLAKL